MIKSLDKMDKKEQLRDYYTNATHKYYLEGASKQRAFSRVCDEWLEAYIQIVDHKVKASYDVNGCAITTSSSEAIARIIDGMDYDDAVKLLEDFKVYLEEQEVDNQEENKDAKIPEEFAPYDFLEKQRSRVKCVLFPVKEFLKKLEQENK